MARLVKNKESKISRLFHDQLRILHFTGYYKSEWIDFIKNTLHECHLDYVWETQQFQSVDWLKIKVCRALKDQFIINWRDSLQNMSSCDVYINFKTSFVFEKYLVSLTPQLTKTFCAFRLNNTRLPKVVGRYTKTPRDQRYCNLCCNGNFFGDEFHLLLECSNTLISFLRN